MPCAESYHKSLSARGSPNRRWLCDRTMRPDKRTDAIETKADAMKMECERTKRSSWSSREV
jgi:hypothetical protein